MQSQKCVDYRLTVCRMPCFMVATRENDMTTINEFAAATLIAPTAAQVRVFEGADDRGVWFGLERRNGTGWLCMSPAHPTFWTREAAENYVSLKFK
jgi:hypothetical protein